MATKELPKTADAAILAVSALHVGTTAFILIAAGLRVDVAGCTSAYLLPLTLCIIWLVSCRFEEPWWHRLRLYVGNLAAFSFISAAGAVSTYGLARLSHGYVDSALVRADRLIGFDWGSAYRWMLVHPTIRRAGAVAYGLLPVTPAVTLTALAITGRCEHAGRFVLAYGVCLYATIWISALLPCRSALPVFYPNGAPYITALGYVQAETIEALRTGGLAAVPAAKLSGLVNFPSFHAASGILFGWAAWPLRWLRWPLIAMNGAMILATPIEGNHYLVDVLGGACVAIAAILLIETLDRRHTCAAMADGYGLALVQPA